MSSEKKRVHFLAPVGIVEQADALAAAEDRDRTDIILAALREYLRSETADERVEQLIAGAYYDGELTHDQVRQLVGPQRAADFRVLKRELSDDYIDEIADTLE